MGFSWLWHLVTFCRVSWLSFSLLLLKWLHFDKPPVWNADWSPQGHFDCMMRLLMPQREPLPPLQVCIRGSAVVLCPHVYIDWATLFSQSRLLPPCGRFAACRKPHPTKKDRAFLPAVPLPSSMLCRKCCFPHFYQSSVRMMSLQKTALHCWGQSSEYAFTERLCGHTTWRLLSD